MRPALFCVPLLPVLKRTRAEFEPRGVQAFAYLDDISIGMMEITPDTGEVVPFLQRELSNIGIAIDPSKTVALPPKGARTYAGTNRPSSRQWRQHCRTWWG